MEKGLTISELFKRIVKKKIIFSILFICFSIVLFLSFEFGFNRNYKNYEIEFAYNDLDISGLDTTFDYRSLTTLNSLKYIKESDDKYKDIDVEEIIDKNAVQIQMDEEMYHIEIKAKYFDSYDIAKEFIYDLINIPVNKAKELVEDDNTKYLKLFDNANSYQLQISYLEKQYLLLLGICDDITAYFGNITDVSNLRKELEFYYTESFDIIKTDLELNGYRKDSDEYEKYLNNQKELLIIKKESLVNKRGTLEAYLEDLAIKGFINTDVDSYATEIASLTSQIIDIDDEIKIIDKQLAYNSDSEAFELKLIDNKNKLIEFSEKTQELEIELFESIDHIFIMKNFSEAGGINIAVSILSSALLSLVISGFICLLINKKNHEE